MKRLTFAFLLGVVCGWWRREDPFVKHYGYNPAREPWDIYS